GSASCTSLCMMCWTCMDFLPKEACPNQRAGAALVARGASSGTRRNRVGLPLEVFRGPGPRYLRFRCDPWEPALRSSQALLGLRELPPCVLGRPPDQLASEQDDAGQRHPRIKVSRPKARTENNHRHDHREVVGAGVAAMRAPASF